MRLYRVEAVPELVAADVRRRTRKNYLYSFIVCAVLFSFALGAFADPPAPSSLFHYSAGGFSYEVRLRSPEAHEAHATRVTNSPPQALSRAITAPADEDTTVHLSASNIDDSSAMFFLTSLPASGKLYQFAGKGRTTLIQPGAAVSDPQHRIIFAPAANSSGTAPSHFDFVANDQKGVSAPATVTLSVLPTEPPRFIDIKRLEGGLCWLLFRGHTNTAYHISASSDLINWQNIGVPTPVAAELFVYEDNDASRFAKRFYRVHVGEIPPASWLTGVERQSDGNWLVKFSGGAYWPHSVWASSDLFTWRRLGAAEETAPGVFQFADKDASSMPQRFYRASSP